jgi:DMSO/TMAO reductase YedYZ molybdopterin-dependent catalytic subunit
MEEKLVISPDTKRENRLPPGQKVVKKLPVLQYDGIPQIDIDEWRFKVWGCVEREIELTFGEFKSLPTVKVYSDVHCVTGWSKLGIKWKGVSSRTIADICKPKGANFAIVHSADGYKTNISLENFLEEDVVFAWEMDEREIPTEHGYPVRLVVPRLYFWKSAKWVVGVRFTEEDEEGYWESRGYHNRGNPWKEERYKQREWYDYDG